MGADRQERRPVAPSSAAVILMLIGTLLVLPGVALFLMFASRDCVLGSACLDARPLSTVGAVMVSIGIVHVVVGAGAWRGRGWGRWLGALVSVVGLGATGAAFVLGGDTGLVTIWAGWSIAYGLSLVGLWRWRQPAPGE